MHTDDFAARMRGDCAKGHLNFFTFVNITSDETVGFSGI